jgi:hypothetical protein
MSKALHFAPNLVPLVLNGSKTTTWRLFDDKDLSVGDTLEMLETGSERHFASSSIVSVQVLTLGELWKGKMEGHEKYKSEQEMYDTYRGYYNHPVGPDTEVKVIRFKLINPSR